MDPPVALRLKMWQVLLLGVLAAPPGVLAAWDVDAGLVQPLGGSLRTVTVSSNPANTQNIIDGNDNTQWQSDGCLPTGFISRDDINPVRNACLTAGRCTATTGSTNVNNAFDTSFYTGATIRAANGVASITVNLPAAKTQVYQVYFRGSWGTGTAQVNLISPTGVSTTVATADSTVNWKDQVIKGSWDDVAAVQVVSTVTFTLTELALQAERCFEYATVDMQAVHSVSMIRARWWSPDSINTTLSISEDGVTWTVLRSDLVPTALSVQELWYAEQPLQARYLSIRHVVSEASNWRKVYMWELAAYPAGGRWGPAPAAVPRSETLRQLLGLNGIWGWGSQMFSDTAVKQGKGPLLYNAVATSGRNYQNMNWDVKKPGNDPKWDTMNKTGTDGQWWLDWDREYRAWKGAGLPVSVSYSFLARDQPPSAWSDPYGISYTLGFKFARHFGPTSGTGDVVSFEAGNEPWDYSAAFYTQLLRGFTDGAQAGDPAVKRLPCALQAYDPLAENPNAGYYIGARLPQDLAPKIDALNLHTYSYYNNATGQRVGVHPEHPGSSMNGLHNMLAWRDANMPGVPVWVTEWGWDANRPGETCGTTTECVSQLAQAAYGIRGLSLLARKGVAQSHWFFYANDDKCETLYCRSGLRDTASRDFAELPVYRAFNALLQLAGSATFQAAPVENFRLHVHVLKTPDAAAPTHVLAWRPVPVGDAETAADSEMMTFNIGFAASGATAAWKLSGALPDGKEAAALPTISGAQWTMAVSSIPTLVVLA